MGEFASFCEEYLVQSIDRWDGLPLSLEPWQLEMFGEVLAYDERGLPVWTSAVIVLPRKNGKTQLLAAYAVWRLLTSEGMPEILLAASSDKQAQRLFEACANFIYRSELLGDLLRVRDHAGQIAREDGMGTIHRLSSDPARLHGYNPSLVVVDELHGWTTPSLERAYGALTTGGGARSHPQVITITTAGEAARRKSSILGRILDGALADGRVERKGALTVSRHQDARMLLYNWEAETEDPSDISAIKAANPASWITEEFLAKQSANPELTTAQFLQLHGCVWAEATTTFVGPAYIGAAQEGWTPLSRDEKVVLGFDGSERRDETWLVACSLDGRIEPLGRWAKPQGSSEDWRVPRDEVHAAVDAAFRRFDVLEFAFDPPGWYSEGDEWAARWEERVVMFETRQSTRFAPACERMRTALMDGSVRFGGPHSDVLAGHFGNAVVRETPAGVTIGKDHQDSPRKVDGAVAAIIAYDRASWHSANTADSLAMLVAFS